MQAITSGLRLSSGSEVSATDAAPNECGLTADRTITSESGRHAFSLRKFKLPPPM